MIAVTVLLIFSLGVISSEWIRENYVPAPKPFKIPKTARIQQPTYHMLGVDAVRRFSELPSSKQDTVIANLSSNLISMNEWLEQLRQADYKFFCLGEQYEEATRQFLAETFFSRFRIDVLLLETSAKGLVTIHKQMAAGEAHVSLLDADISRIIRSARAKSRELIVAGVDETKAQRRHRERQANPGFRDQSIAFNLQKQFRPRKRHAALFGALHCTNQPNWLFERVRNATSPLAAQDMLNIAVLGEHQEGPVEAFVYFLDEIGIQRKDFVIPHTNLLHPLIYEWFSPLTKTFGYFRTVVVFRTYV